MNIIHTDAYRSAFVEYLRRGTPIRLRLKQAEVTDQYVWRTRRDERVRPSHRRNDGRIFSWASPPDTGHPGEDYNCRCEGFPYVEGQTEFAFHDFSTSLASSHDRWTNADFVRHYYFGAGRSVTLLEIGHLRGSRSTMPITRLAMARFVASLTRSPIWRERMAPEG